MASVDLTRSITAPSFITRQIQSCDHSQEDLLGSSYSLPAGNQQLGTEDSAAQTVINIKHALSETLSSNSGQETGGKLSSSVHIGKYSPGESGEGEEEGPFTITFRNVSEAQVTTRSLSLESGQLLEDKEVESVLNRDRGSTSSVVSARSIGVGGRIKKEVADKINQTNNDYFVDSGGGCALVSDSNNQRFVRFTEFNKGRSELSESSDSSVDRGSSLYVECDSDVHSVSDVLSDDLNNSCAKLVIAHITDVESLVSKRSITTSISFEEPKTTHVPYLEKQNSEVIPPSSYHYRELDAYLSNNKSKSQLSKYQSNNNYNNLTLSSESVPRSHERLHEDLITVSRNSGEISSSPITPTGVILPSVVTSKSTATSSKSTMTVTQVFI